MTGHEDTRATLFSIRRSFAWHRREFFNMRRFRKTHGRPPHLPAWHWRLLEYRYLYYVAKQVLRRA